MRDKRENEIDTIMFDLKDLWKEHPGMRLGQLLVCLAAGSVTNLFYTPDDQLGKYLNAKIQGGEWPLSSEYTTGPEFSEVQRLRKDALELSEARTERAKAQP